MLPSFPPFTHADPNIANSGLKPWESVNKFINDIPYGAPNHDRAVLEATSFNFAPWCGNSIAPRCITTHGGQNYHPSGKRHLTNREYATLQGFPLYHLFSDSNIKRQIGNAVPPSIAKVLFEWIRKALEKTDGIQSESTQQQGIQRETIIID